MRFILKEDGGLISMESGLGFIRLEGDAWVDEPGAGGQSWSNQPGTGGQSWTEVDGGPQTWTEVTS